MTNDVYSSLAPLTKDEIKLLGGGPIRGEYLLVRAEQPTGPPFRVYGQLWNQHQSKQSPCHPEGSEPIKAEGIESKLVYDIARATIEAPVPYARRCVSVYREFPAQLYRYDSRREDHQLFRREARLWASRTGVLCAISRHWGNARLIAQLMTEALGIPWQATTGERLSARIRRFADQLDQKTCDDLTSLLAVQAIHQPSARRCEPLIAGAVDLARTPGIEGFHDFVGSGTWAVGKGHSTTPTPSSLVTQ